MEKRFQKRKVKIFPKTFLNTLMILSGIILVIHAVIYFTFPVFYVENQRAKIVESANVMVEYLDDQESKDIPMLLEAYAKNIGITAHLKSDVENGAFPLLHDLDIQVENSSNYIIIEERTITTKDGKTMDVQFISGTNMLQDAIDIALLYLPFTFIAAFFFALIFSYVYSKRLLKPLFYIEEVTKRMENMELDAKFNEDNKDELGKVGAQINKVYSTLLVTIDELEGRNKEILRMQEQKISFLRGASHELKTPLASIRIILENMKYNVGKYKNHDKYLEETINKVDELNILLRDILMSSKFEEWTENKEEMSLRNKVSELAGNYEELAMRKKIKIINSVPEGVTILMSRQAIDKVLSNIISNAVKYSPENEYIHVSIEDDYFIVENKCSPLSQEQLNNLFKIFYHAQVVGKKNDGTGLGLYIVKNILDSYQMKYSFEPYDEGMKFKIKIK